MERVTGLHFASRNSGCALKRSARRPKNAPPGRFLDGLRPHRFESRHSRLRPKRKMQPLAGCIRNYYGAGDGTRTRACELGKLVPYHLATPASLATFLATRSYNSALFITKHANSKNCKNIFLRRHLGWGNIFFARFASHARAWRNWQTRTVQVRMGFSPWRFKSSRPHHKSSRFQRLFL